MKNLPQKLKSILLVDDDEVTNFFNSHLIQKMGLADHIHAELNGQAALEYLTQNLEGESPNPNLILLDINMPIMNGFEFLEKYEGLSPEQRKNQVLVMLTSSNLNVDKDRAKQFSSLRDFYPKPLSEACLQEIVQKYFTTNGAA